MLESKEVFVDCKIQNDFIINKINDSQFALSIPQFNKHFIIDNKTLHLINDWSRDKSFLKALSNHLEIFLLSTETINTIFFSNKLFLYLAGNFNNLEDDVKRNKYLKFSRTLFSSKTNLLLCKVFKNLININL